MRLYTLPPLGYAYDALEPHLERDIMRFHHDEHHAAYVKNANRAVQRLHDAREHQDLDKIDALEKELAFNLSGHVLHSIFWRNLSPEGGGEPVGELRQQIDADFGSFASFRQQVISTATSIMGSGWAALVWEPVGQGLVIVPIHDHQSNTVQASQPLMVLDAWEHAYYLQYQNRKADYFEAIWQLWSWEDIDERLQRARDSAFELPEAGARLEPSERVL